PTTSVLVRTAPGDDGIPVRIQRNRRVLLDRPRGIGIDLKLASHGHARGIVPLHVYSPCSAVLLIAGPRDCEIPRLVHSNGGKLLVVGSVGVYPELTALYHSVRIVALGVYPIAASILCVAGPGDHKVTIGVHGYRGVLLVIRRVRIDSKLA